MKIKIIIAKGDGVGPEVINAAIGVLNKIAILFKHSFEYIEIDIGGASIDKFGEPLTTENLKRCRDCGVVLLGSVGGPKWDKLEQNKRPEAGILKLRKELGVFANLRPAKIKWDLRFKSPIKPHMIYEMDIIIVRELTGGIYFGQKGYDASKNEAYDVEKYTKNEIQRVAKHAFSLANRRNKTLVSIDKANVLETGRLWRETVEELSQEYPDVKLSHMYVDNAAMQIIANPKSFSTILTSNMFGDILSDELGALTGSIGLLPSASLGKDYGLYEPIHGSAPDIAGKDLANPIAAIESAAMMLELSFGLLKEANTIRKAVDSVLEDGYRTFDLMDQNMILVSGSEFGKKIEEKISNIFLQV